jgi:hypothetical protein
MVTDEILRKSHNAGVIIRAGLFALLAFACLYDARWAQLAAAYYCIDRIDVTARWERKPQHLV